MNEKEQQIIILFVRGASEGALWFQVGFKLLLELGQRKVRGAGALKPWPIAAAVGSQSIFLLVVSIFLCAALLPVPNRIHDRKKSKLF